MEHFWSLGMAHEHSKVSIPKDPQFFSLAQRIFLFISSTFSCTQSTKILQGILRLCKNQNQIRIKNDSNYVSIGSFCYHFHDILFFIPSRERFGTRRHTANKSASRHLAKEANTASCPFWTLEVPEGHSGSRKTIHRMPHTSVWKKKIIII